MGDPQPPQWMAQLDERQNKEVMFALTYARQFAHGTDGHHRLLLIAKLVELLNKVESGAAPE
jgi:hypothetical protein